LYYIISNTNDVAKGLKTVDNEHCVDVAEFRERQQTVNEFSYYKKLNHVEFASRYHITISNRPSLNIKTKMNMCTLIELE
jgi:hypothetical protein